MIPEIGSLMSEEIFSIDGKRTVQEAAEEMLRLGIGSLLVKHEAEYVGMITEVDIVRKVVAKGHTPAIVQVKEVMAAPLISIEAQQSVIEANALMEEKKLRHLVVRHYGDIVGVVSVRDFLHPIYMEEEAEIHLEKASGF